MARPDLGNECSALMESDPGRSSGRGSGKARSQVPSPLGKEGSSVPGVGTGYKQEVRCGFVVFLIVITAVVLVITTVAVKQQFFDLVGQLSLVTQPKRGPLNPSGPPGVSSTGCHLSRLHRM